MTGPSCTLSEAIEQFAERCGILEWHYEPYAGLGYRVSVRLGCDVCKARWTYRADAGGWKSRESIVAGLLDSADGHVCQLDLGPAGRVADEEHR